MAISIKKKIFFLVFCLASVTQGMYSTYFVSILTTIERIYQIQSKTAGAIMSATEIGQILGSLLIAYYGKNNKPKWIAACMTLTAIAALISTSPHFLLNNITAAPSIATTSMLASPYLTTDISTKSSLSSQSFISSSLRTNLTTQDQLCHLNDPAELLVLNSTQIVNSTTSIGYQGPTGSILVIFFFCLLAIGFGSTALTTLGIPYIDDIVSKEESPLYLGLSIGLKIFGPALGFILGSFCVGLDVNWLTMSQPLSNISNEFEIPHQKAEDLTNIVGAWWLGLIVISLPLLILALPMYFLSRANSCDNSPSTDEFEDITYQAAEDHDIGGSRDFQHPHVLTIGDLDVTSNRTCYSEVVDSSSREVLQAKTSNPSPAFRTNFSKNITLDQPIITGGSILNEFKDESDGAWKSSCVIVNHFGGLESTSFIKDDVKSLRSSSYATTSSSSSNTAKQSRTTSTTTNATTMNLSSSLSRLISNKLLLLRTLSCVLHILPIAGFYTFFPKYLIEQFRIAPSSASIISGLAGILFVGLGAFVGGMIIRIFNVNSKIMTSWIASSALLYAIGMLILMNLGCPQNQAVHFESEQFTSTDCSATCHCSPTTYSPVCANGTTFMSPCLAGCKSYTTSEGKIIFDECGCSSVSGKIYANPQSMNQSHQLYNQLIKTQSKHLNLNVATQGHCLHSCDNLIWYIIIFSTFTFIHASCEVGSMMFNLRCVNSNDRTLALGLITFASSLLGKALIEHVLQNNNLYYNNITNFFLLIHYSLLQTGSIPCSVIYGTVIDLTCIHWDSVSYLQNGGESLGTSTGVRGACRAYRNDTFRYYLHGTTAFVMFLAFLVDCIISRRANDVDFYDKKDCKDDEVKVGLKKSTETI